MGKTERKKRQNKKRYLANCDKWTIGAALARNGNTLNCAARTNPETGIVPPAGYKRSQSLGADNRAQKAINERANFKRESKFYSLWELVKIGEFCGIDLYSVEPKELRLY